MGLSLSITSAALAACISFVGFFLKCDCDLYLRTLTYNSTNAFKDQVVWIAGASSGIGASLAHDFVKAGAKVIISARRESLLKSVAESCSALGQTPEIIAFDVTNSDDLNRASDAVIKKYGHVDILVLNAGRSQRALAIDTPIDETINLMNLNFLSYVSLSKAVLPNMIPRNKGQVIRINSVFITISYEMTFI